MYSTKTSCILMSRLLTGDPGKAAAGLRVLPRGFYGCGEESWTDGDHHALIAGERRRAIVGDLQDDVHLFPDLIRRARHNEAGVVHGTAVGDGDLARQRNRRRNIATR